MTFLWRNLSDLLKSANDVRHMHEYFITYPRNKAVIVSLPSRDGQVGSNLLVANKNGENQLVLCSCIDTAVMELLNNMSRAY